MSAAPSWGNSVPFLFDLRGEATWLVCVECFVFATDISTLSVTDARDAADAHIQAVHSG